MSTEAVEKAMRELFPPDVIRNLQILQREEEDREWATRDR